MREIIFDTETTGLSPITGDRLVEIGCVELVNRVETGRTFHAYFNPGRPMHPDAEAVHGLSTAFLSDKPKFGDKLDDLLNFLGHGPLVAHNAAFDFGFLNHELGLAKRPSICMTRMVDTLPMDAVPQQRDTYEELARRMWMLERERTIALLVESGCPVVPWSTTGALDRALRELGIAALAPRVAAR